MRRAAVSPCRSRGVIPALLGSVLVAVSPTPPVSDASAAPPRAASSSPWGPIQRVEGAPPQRLLVKGKPYVYFRVARRLPIHFVVRGPALLVVITRAERDSGSTGPAPYFVRVMGAHAVLKGLSPESSPSSEARLADGGRAILCESRRAVVPLREREQHVWISVSGAPGVYVRLLLRPGGEGDEGVRTLPPGAAFRTVTVREGGRETSYSSVARGKRVRFRAAGVESIEIISRLDFGPAARDSSGYVLAVSSGGRELGRLSHRVLPSARAVYTDLPGRVPSEPARDVLPLGPGVKEITVELLEPREGIAEVRAAVPETASDEEE